MELEKSENLCPLVQRLSQSDGFTLETTDMVN